MQELFHKGIERIVYKSKGFATGKAVTCYIWSPSLVKSSLQSFIEIESGLYYLDYNFNENGKYIGIFYENSILSGFSTFHIIEELELIQEDILTLLKIETGRWKIVNKQFIIYDSDGTTVLYKFNLRNKFGVSTETDVFEREPV